MKISGSKNMGFKQFALKHGEKGGVLLIGLIVLLVLLKTNWATIEKTPEELAQKATDARTSVVQSEWTQEEKDNFRKETGWEKRLLAMTKPIDLSRYIPGRLPGWPLRPQQIVMHIPIVLSLKSPIAHEGRFFDQIKFVKADAKDENEEETKPEKTKENPLGIPPSEKQKKKKKKKDKKKNPGGIPGPVSRSNNQKGKKTKAGEKSIDGIGRRYIVVLGVFDLKEQLKEFSRAMGLKESVIQGQNLARIVNFKVERRLVDHAGNPLSDWIPLDRKSTIDILKRSKDFEAEIVDNKYVNGVLLSPLPSIVPDTGEWDKTVIHPDMRVVNDDQQAVQKQLDDLIRGYIEEENRKKNKGKKIHDYGDELVDDEITADDILKDKKKRDAIVKTMLDSYPNGDPKRDMVEELIASRTRQDKLMFRFFDFDVQKHRWYQHRVKIVMSNPLEKLKKRNLQANAKEAANVSVIESQWSQPTPPTSTGNDYSYFLTDAMKQRTLGALPTINVELYEWIQKYGMFTKAIFANMTIGNPVGGSKKTDVPEPLYNRFKQQKVTFNTDNYLVDIDTAPNLDNELRSSLSLSRAFFRDTGISEQITVIDEYGELKVIDKLSLRKTRDQYKESLEMYHKRFDKLRKKKKKPKGDDPGLGGPGGN